MIRLLFNLTMLLLLCACNPAQNTKSGPRANRHLTTISNLNPRTTVHGQIVDAHDGRVIEFEGRYYWYGTRYSTTNGFTKANSYHVYRSDDLVNWEHLGPALINPPEGVYYRPHVIYNETTEQYVLWYNWYPELWDGHFGVASAETPAGPFTILDPDVQVAHSELGVGDFGLFVDEDQTAYISYNTISGHRISVEKLNPDYLSSSLENGGYIAQYCEAGSMFKRNDLYYLLTDYTCCFCNQGAGARVYISKDPLGKWSLTNNINRQPGFSAPKLTDGVSFTADYTSLMRMGDSSFQALVLNLATAKGGSEPIEIAYFTGDRTGQCGQVDIPEVHQPIVRPEFTAEYFEQGWKRVGIRNIEISSQNMIENIRIELDIDRPLTLIRLIPNQSFPYDEIRLTEVSGGVLAAYTSDYQPGPIIIPGQQTYIMELTTGEGKAYIWMADLWGSASDNIKGHDYQYWSSPLQFDTSGWILPLKMEAEWQVELVDKQ